MKVGFGLPVAGEWATPDAIRHVAQRAEALGYASLWTFQRTLHTDALPATHASVLDSTTALAYAAACTQRIRLGTATICAPFTPPAQLAKTLASLDVLSGGRLTVGVGMGWLPEEHVEAGVTLTRRGARFEEHLRCMLACWTEDPVEFAGAFYVVPRSRLRPKPVQRPHPPVLVGASAEPALRRAGRLGNGWICSSEQDLADLDAKLEVVRAGAREARRNPDALEVLVRRTEAQELDLDALAARGVTEAFVDLNLTAGTTLEHAERVLEANAPAG